MKINIIPLFCLIACLYVSCGTEHSEEGDTFIPGADYVQIVLFHLEQRCESCNAVESETLSLLEDEFQLYVDSGKVEFLSLDFQSESGRKAAEILRASGQTLYVVKGDSISNLTGTAFLYASTSPERYRNDLRNELNKFLR